MLDRCTYLGQMHSKSKARKSKAKASFSQKSTVRYIHLIHNYILRPYTYTHYNVRPNHLVKENAKHQKKKRKKIPTEEKSFVM